MQKTEPHSLKQLWLAYLPSLWPICFPWQNDDFISTSTGIMHNSKSAMFKPNCHKLHNNFSFVSFLSFFAAVVVGGGGGGVGGGGWLISLELCFCVCFF